MRSKFTLSLLAVFILSTAPAQVYQWAQGIGGTQNDHGYSVCTAVNGDVLVLGDFSGTADIDGTAGADLHTSAGGADIFFARYDAGGNYLWGKSLGTTGSEFPSSVSADPFGAIYLLLNANGTIDLDPGPGVQNYTCLSVNGDLLLVKYDANGNFIWGKGFQGNIYTTGYSGEDLAFDAAGNIFFASYFNGNVDFDPGPGTQTMNGPFSWNYFLASYDSSGAFRWVRGTTDESYAKAVSTDNNGNVYVTGYFSGSCDFDPGPGTVIVSSNGGPPVGGDVFVAKYSNSGSCSWARCTGGTFEDVGLSLYVDNSNGDVYFSGIYTGDGGNIDFDTGTGTNSIPSGTGGSFVTRLDASGAYQWTNILDNASSFAMCSAIGGDVNGNLVLSGNFGETIDFDPGSGTANMTTPPGASALFLAIYDGGSGAYLTSGAMVTGGFYSVAEMTVTAGGEIYICGSINDTVDFDPSFSVSNVTVAGAEDAFLAHYTVGPLGLADMDALPGTNVFPNPAAAGVFLQLQGFTGSLSLFDMQGRLVRQIAAGIHTLSTEGLEPGVYFLRGDAANGTAVQRVLISR